MFKSLFKAKGPTHEEIAAMAATAEALRRRMARIVGLAAQQPKSMQAPAGAGTVARATLLARAGQQQMPRNAA